MLSELCGDEFKPKRKASRFCYKDHMRDCVICDKEFKIIVLNNPAETCSQKCAGKLSVKRGAQKLESVEKNCSFSSCNDKFTPKNSRQIYCTKQHELPCEVCDTYFPVKQNHRPGRVCSRKCSNKLNSIETNKRNKNKNIRKNCRLCKKEFMTNRRNQVYCKMPHSVNCFSCGKEFKIERAYKGRLEYTCGDMDCRQKLIEHTNNKIYGVQNTFQSEEIKKKIRETNLENLSVEHPSQNKDIMKKVHKTMLKRYGAKVPMKVPKMKRTIMNTNIERHGASNPGLFNIKNIEDYLNFSNYVIAANKSVQELTKYFNVSEKTIRTKIIDSNVEHLFPNFYTLSKNEREIVQLIEDNTDLDITLHNRRIIKPQEIDIYLPNVRVGIEVSPTYTHNSKCGWGGVGKGLDKNYHYDKFKLTNDNNVELITLFDWYDYNKVFSYVKSLIDKDVDMSQLNLKEESYSKTMSTKYDLWDLEMNPEMPDSNTVLSAYDDKELAAIIFANVNNNSINISKIVQSYEYPRDKLLTSIINLLKEKYNVIQIVTNSDITNGSILKSLGFKMTKEIEPSLVYINDYNKKYLKSNNINKVREILGYNYPTKSCHDNVELLEKHGFLPVYDCGWRIFEFKSQC